MKRRRRAVNGRQLLAAGSKTSTAPMASSAPITVALPA
jgi:hypothetical protein